MGHELSGLALIVLSLSVASASESRIQSDSATQSEGSEDTSPTTARHAATARGLCQAVVGALVGTSVGVVTSSFAMGVSAGDPTIADGVSFGVASFTASFAAGFNLGETGMDSLSRKHAMREGSMIGCFAGLISGTMLGSSSDMIDDQTMLQSSKGSDGSLTAPTVPNGKSLALLGKMRAVHVALSGCISGGVVGYLAPEIVSGCNYNLFAGGKEKMARHMTNLQSAANRLAFAFTEKQLKLGLRTHIRSLISAAVDRQWKPAGLTVEQLREELDTVFEGLQLTGERLVFDKKAHMNPVAVNALNEVLRPEGLFISKKGLVFQKKFLSALPSYLPSGMTLADLDAAEKAEEAILQQLILDLKPLSVPRSVTTGDEGLISFFEGTDGSFVFDKGVVTYEFATPPTDMKEALEKINGVVKPAGISLLDDGRVSMEESYLKKLKSMLPKQFDYMNDGLVQTELLL